MFSQQRNSTSMQPTPDWYDWLPVRHQSLGGSLLAFATDPTRIDDFTINVALDAFCTGDEPSFLEEIKSGQVVLPEGRANFTRYESLEHKGLELVLAALVTGS